MGNCKGHEQAAVSMGLRECYHYEDIHFSGPAMAKFSKALAKERGLCEVTLPFCHTILSERFGAPIELGNWNQGVRIGSFEKEITPLKNTLTDGGASKRQQVLMKAIDLLSQEGIRPTLIVDGPLTILTNVLGFENTFRLFRKTPEVVQGMMTQIGQAILDYVVAVAAVAHLEGGIKAEWAISALSFADPVSSEKILGAKVFNALARPHLESLIKSFEPLQTQGIAIGICPVLHGELGIYGSRILSVCQSGKQLQLKKD